MKRFFAILLLMIAACLTAKTTPVMNSDPNKPSILIAIQKGAQSDFKQELIK